MKIVFAKKLPSDCYLAFSGGIDSVVLLNVLLKKNCNITLLTIDHNNDFSKIEIEFCKQVAKEKNIPYIIKSIPQYDRSTSLEAFWSRKRNVIFQSMDKPVLTGHHLSDATEWYFMTSCQGNSRIMSYQNENVIRPLLTISKKTIIEYANKFNLTYLTDPTNEDNNFNLRNKVRNVVLPTVKNVFPGLEKTVRRLIIDSLKSV